MTSADRRIAGDGYYHGRLDEELGQGGKEVTDSPEWREFADSWNRLLLDDYMADGGTYRLRRYSEFICTADDLQLAPHVPYAQSLDVNYLNGGVERHYEPFEDDTAGSPILARLVSWAVGRLDTLVGEPTTWRLQTFQNRIVARTGRPGKPTPEGVHRDGVDYVIALLVDRVGVRGGTSEVWTAGRQRLAGILLSDPGEFILNDDERTMHSVRPIEPDGAGDGHRDVLIAMFTRMTPAA